MHRSFLNVWSTISATAVTIKKIKSNDNLMAYKLLFQVWTALATLAYLFSVVFRAEWWSNPLSSPQWRREHRLAPLPLSYSLHFQGRKGSSSSSSALGPGSLEHLINFCSLDLSVSPDLLGGPEGGFIIRPWSSSCCCCCWLACVNSSVMLTESGDWGEARSTWMVGTLSDASFVL